VHADALSRSNGRLEVNYEGTIAIAMKKGTPNVLITSLLVALGTGCQLVNTGTEIRTDEQMLNVSFENAKAQEVFAAIIYGSERETHVTTRIGIPSASLYSRNQTVAFNAHCNDHIRAMDKNADLLITQQEAEDYYRMLVDQGKLKGRK
jgi:hypothetical protein